jgi:hypothetical protein
MLIISMTQIFHLKIVQKINQIQVHFIQIMEAVTEKKETAH